MFRTVNVETKLVRKDGTLIDCMLSAVPLSHQTLKRGG
jgi:hypothetical protein